MIGGRKGVSGEAYALEAMGRPGYAFSAVVRDACSSSALPQRGGGAETISSGTPFPRMAGPCTLVPTRPPPAPLELDSQPVLRTDGVCFFFPPHHSPAMKGLRGKTASPRCSGYREQRVCCQIGTCAVEVAPGAASTARQCTLLDTGKQHRSETPGWEYRGGKGTDPSKGRCTYGFLSLAYSLLGKSLVHLVPHFR